MAWLVDGRGSGDPVEPVVPLWEQLRAQHKRAVETSGVRLSAWAAFSQQSIPSIAGMLHSCSFECKGTPAKALPPITKTSASDAKRIIIARTNLWKPTCLCQGELHSIETSKRSKSPID